MNLRKMLVACLTGLFFLLFAGGIFSYAILDEPPAEAKWAGPLFLFSALFVVMISSSSRLAGWLAAVFAGGIAAEIAGLYTGLPFGNYNYTLELGPQVLGVPLAIGAAWGVLLAYAACVSALLNRFTGALIGALWMVSADLLIDPLASGPLGYWKWAGDSAYYGIPTLNFFGWFAVSYVLLLLLPRSEQLPRPYRLIGLSIISFYGLLALFHPETALLALMAVLLIGLDTITQYLAFRGGKRRLSCFGPCNPLVYERRTRFEMPASELFNWHTQAGAFEKLKPPWQRMDVVTTPVAIAAGQVVHVVLRFGPLRVPWISEIVSVNPGHSFVDEQRSGPWALWRHEHNFIAADEASCIMEDQVVYALPLGALGELFGGWMAEYQLQKLFSYRHKTLQDTLKRN